MNTPSITGNKFLSNKIYKTNIKARGQKLQISKNFSKKKASGTNNNPILNKYKNNYKKENNYIKNIDKKNIFEEIKNTKNKIEQYENFLKKSLHKKLPSEFENTNIKSYEIDDDLTQQLNINNILNSLNRNYNDYESITNINKKPTNISLINNSLILNYMNKINNNISVNNNNEVKNQVRSSYTSIENSLDNNKSEPNYTPNYKKVNEKKKIYSNNINNNNNKKINISTNVEKGKVHSIKPKNPKISYSQNKFYDSSFGQNNNSILKNIKSISIKKIENNGSEIIKKRKNIKLNLEEKMKILLI